MSGENRLRASDSERDAVLSVLQEAHAVGRLDLAELDERQDRVIAARHVDELLPVITDLPEGGLLAQRLGSGTTALPARSTGHGVGAELQRAEDPHTGTVAIMSGRDLRPLRGTESIGSFNFWGGDTIDLSDCFGPGVRVQVDSIAIMGGSVIKVPAGVRVVDEAIAIMAGNSIDRAAQGDGSQGTLVLKGFAFWGGNSVELAEG